MRDDFVFFILSHGRPNDQYTLNLLLSAGYTGDWYIICDNLDESLDQYKEIYGDKIIVFDKDEWFDKTDTFETSRDYRSVVYARNASIQIAKDMGYKYMAQFDDDQKSFMIRYEMDDKLKSQKIDSNIDTVISAFVDMLEETPVEALAFGHGMNYIGGINGPWQKQIGNFLYSTFFFKVDADFEFRGLHNEDYILTSHYAKRGRLLYNIFTVQTHDFERGSNEGGLQGLYRDFTTYAVAFYAVIESPDSTKVRVDKRGDSNISQPQRFRIPCVLNEKWRKSDAQ